jgi:hypothetical protein
MATVAATTSPRNSDTQRPKPIQIEAKAIALGYPDGEAAQDGATIDEHVPGNPPTRRLQLTETRSEAATTHTCVANASPRISSLPKVEDTHI